jgi:predicted nucleotidyltransferase
MQAIVNYVGRIAENFKSKLGPALIEVYKIGSLAHGGFSQIYSDIDIGLILSCQNPPSDMDRMITEAKALDGEYGKKLSVFWGNPQCSWGRLPALDRLDLLDHGVPLLYNRRADFRRPTQHEIRQQLSQTIERSWKPNIDELSKLKKLEPKDRKPYIRTILYPARLIYSWDNLAMDSNDRAVEYLRNVRPPGLDLGPIQAALACRREDCSAEEVFALGADLNWQLESTVSYISLR